MHELHMEFLERSDCIRNFLKLLEDFGNKLLEDFHLEHLTSHLRVFQIKTSRGIPAGSAGFQKESRKKILEESQINLLDDSHLVSLPKAFYGRIPHGIPGAIFQQIPQWILEWILEGTSEGIVVGNLGGISGEILVESQKKPLQGTITGIPEGTAWGITEEASKEFQRESPMGSQKKKSEFTFEQTRDGTPCGISGGTPGRNPKWTSWRTYESIPGINFSRKQENKILQ